MLGVVATPTDFLQPSQGSGDKTCPREQACWPSAGQSHKAGTNGESLISSSSLYFLDFFSPFLQLQLSTKLDKKDKLYNLRRLDNFLSIYNYLDRRRGDYLFNLTIGSRMSGGAQWCFL